MGLEPKLLPNQDRVKYIIRHTNKANIIKSPLGRPHPPQFIKIIIKPRLIINKVKRKGSRRESHHL